MLSNVIEKLERTLIIGVLIGVIYLCFIDFDTWRYICLSLPGAYVYCYVSNKLIVFGRTVHIKNIVFHFLQVCKGVSQLENQ